MYYVKINLYVYYVLYKKTEGQQKWVKEEREKQAIRSEIAIYTRAYKTGGKVGKATFSVSSHYLGCTQKHTSSYVQETVSVLHMLSFYSPQLHRVFLWEEITQAH